MREIRTLRAMWRGLETAYGTAIEALPTETGSPRLGWAYGAKRQSSTLPRHCGECRSYSSLGHGKEVERDEYFEPLVLAAPIQ